MADAAARTTRMTVAEFLDWSSGDDTRHELIGGVPLAMAPPSPGHSTIAFTLAGLIREALGRNRHCVGRSEAGLRSVLDDSSYFQADLAVFCRDAGQSDYRPVAIVEVLSPSTEDHDRKVKLPDYRAMESVAEVALVDSARRYCEVHRRTADGRWLTDLLVAADAHLRLDSIGLDAPLAAIYAGVEIEPDRIARP